MKGNHLLLTAAFLFVLSAAEGFSQITSPIYSAAAPEAASLGEYGAVPVSLYTGTPNISIPLGELTAGSYSLPISVSYHVGSVKPKLLPGSMGMGWSLQAAGCISRTVRGIPDEKKDALGLAHGFYGHYNKLTGNNLTTNFDQYTAENMRGSYGADDWFELSADEFSFTAGAYSGNFYLSPTGQWKVVCDADVKVEFDSSTGFFSLLDLEDRIPDITHWANRDENTRFFGKFTITTPDGVQYEFGGVEATDFSIAYYNRNASDLIATAWHLKRIVTVDDRQITFTYETDMEQQELLADLHYSTGRTTAYGFPASNYSFLHKDIYGRAGYSGFLMFPATLKGITGPNGSVELLYDDDRLYREAMRDHTAGALYWEDASIRTENLYTWSASDPRYQFFALMPITDQGGEKANQQAIAEALRHLLLKRINFRTEGGRSLSWFFTFRGLGRSKLESIQCREGIPPMDTTWVEGGGVMYPVEHIPADTSSTSLPQWQFTYNTDRIMPMGYMFPETDPWGIWKGGKRSPASPFSPSDTLSSLLQIAKSETLKEIYWPTGGHTELEYELNESSASAFPDGHITEGYHQGGGLRIGAVTQYGRDGKLLLKKRYTYTLDGDPQGTSSGIMWGYAPGRSVYLFSGDRSFVAESDEGYPASSTNMNTPPVGYSLVKEERIDSTGTPCGYTLYQYTNYDTDIFGQSHPDETAWHRYNCTDAVVGVPFTANSAERGKLLSEKHYTSSGTLVSGSVHHYSRVSNDSLVTASQRSMAIVGDPQHRVDADMGWLTYTRTYAYLEDRIEESLYDTTGTVTSTKWTTYNASKMPRKVRSAKSDGSVLDKTFTYTCDTTLYGWMTARHILALPVRIATSSGGEKSIEEAQYYSVTGALGHQVPYIKKITTWKEYAGAPGVRQGEKTVRQVNDVDGWGNPLLAVENGLTSQYTWGYQGQKVIRVVDNWHQVRGGNSSIPWDGEPSNIVLNMDLPSGSLGRFVGYDANLSPIFSAGPDGLMRRWSYDAMGRLASEWESDAHDEWISARPIKWNKYVFAPVSSPGWTEKFDYPETGYTTGDIGVEIPPDVEDEMLEKGYVFSIPLEWRSAEYQQVYHTNERVFTVTDSLDVRLNVTNFLYYRDVDPNFDPGEGWFVLHMDLYKVRPGVGADSLVMNLPFIVKRRTLQAKLKVGRTTAPYLECTLPRGLYKVVLGAVDPEEDVAVIDDEPIEDEGDPVIGQGLNGGNGLNSVDPDDPGTPDDPDDPIGLDNFPSLYLRIECPPLYEDLTADTTTHVLPHPYANMVRQLESRDGTVANVSETRTWFDGLGRKAQTVLRGWSPSSSKDLASGQTYDAWGRLYHSYLPAAIVQNANGRYGADTLSQALSVQYGVSELPWSNQTYDGSPLDRITEQYGPGYAWQNAGKATRKAWQTNVGATAPGADPALLCRRFVCAGPASGDTVNLWSVSAAGYYPAGMLYAERTSDEDGQVQIAFKDLDGNLVLERRVLPAVNNNGSPQYLDTYYIYSPLGNLLAVLPPMASATITGSSGSVSASDMDAYAFQYQYDARNCVAEKKLPGAGRTLYVYDDADRVVLVQDANSRARGEALFTLYDVFGRTCVTGVCTNAVSSGDRLTDVVTVTYTGSGTLGGYDVSGISLSSAKVLTVQWHDGYGFVHDILGDAVSVTAQLRYGTPAEYTYGQITGSWSAILGEGLSLPSSAGSSNGVWAVNRYDRRGRAASVISRDHLGSVTIEDTEYNHRGSPINRHVVHGYGGNAPLEEHYAFTYDNENRLLTTIHAIGTASATILEANTYDSLGRLAQTSAYGGNAVSRSYDYNIRSNITSIACSQLTETLYYNSAPSGGTPRWGGGIAGVNFAANGVVGQTWKYTYDGAGRLTLALREDSLPGTPLYGQDRFTYDRNGNILSLTNKLGTDSLTVAAPRTGNRLTAATYDANGNETSCTTEGTLSIVYNRLNLPERIVLSGNDTVRYWYYAAGVKLRENTTDYSGSLVIKNGTLDKLLVPTGYVAANGNITSNGQYVYFVKDHLGSIRATVAQNGTVLERYWFGPYGDDVPAPGQTTVQTSTTDNPYRFSGKERTPADYDFGARRYLPFRVPRWTTMDPMAEKYFSISPYAYCAGDPVRCYDPDGMDWVDANGNKIKDHTKIKAYIFYDPREEGKGFAKQSKEMYKQLETKYGKGSVAMSNVTTEKEFVQDWRDMASSNIKEVNLNYHGNNQTIILDAKEGEYITATGNGESNRSETPATNVQDLPTPSGDISNAQLNINTCKSNSKTQYTLKGSKQTLMEAFFESTNFKIVRGTSSGVSYDRKTLQPFPGHSWKHGTWDYMRRPGPVSRRYPGVGLPPK